MQRRSRSQVADLQPKKASDADDAIESVTDAVADTASHVYEAASQTLSKLVSYHELQEWQKDNHFILSGYARASNSLKGVLHSLFYLHNESVNIYTHLLPALVISVVLALLYDWYLPTYPETIASDNVALLVFGAGCIICLGLSATFHTCKSHSHKVMRFGNKLDYLGICVLIAASTVSILHFGFDDYPKLRLLFTALSVCLGIVCSCVSLIDHFCTPPWRPFRASMFIAYGLSGALPVLVSLSMLGLDETLARVGLKYMLLEALFYISGAVIYGMLVPERWFPGTFDIFGHSHQVFHVFVVVAAYCHFQALLMAYEASVLRR